MIVVANDQHLNTATIIHRGKVTSPSFLNDHLHSLPIVTLVSLRVLMILEFLTVIIRQLRTKNTSGDLRLKLQQLYCINELLANDALLVSKIPLGYEKIIL